jgi:hypothetical protein
MELGRFEGMLETHISLLKSLAARNEREWKEAPRNDPFLRGLRRGSADSYSLAARWLEETLEKERAKENA